MACVMIAAVYAHACIASEMLHSVFLIMIACQYCMLHAGSPCHVADYSSLQGSALLGGVNVLHSAFPADADEEYKTQGNHIYIKIYTVMSRMCMTLARAGTL